jgi:hypothetical protein
VGDFEVAARGYALLTRDVHNNLAALGDRHYLDTGENGTVAFFADNSDKSEMQLSMATGYLLRSAEMVHRAFQTGDTAVSELLLKFDPTRKTRNP